LVLKILQRCINTNFLNAWKLESIFGNMDINWIIFFLLVYVDLLFYIVEFGSCEGLVK
jgi:hypothetical protein